MDGGGSRTEPLIYNTRDAKGNEIRKEVQLKEYPFTKVEFVCKLCGKVQTQGVSVKKIVSANFTDWVYMGEYVCPTCTMMFSLYFYSYIQDRDRVRLLNVREMANEIQKPQKPPYKIVVSTSQKKHLFYKAVFNQGGDNFIANLEEEQISCNLNKLRELFLFVASLQALGESKKNMSQGILRYEILKRVGRKAYLYLSEQLSSRQIQIPLYLSQKLNISEEEAICNLNSILNH